MHGRGPSSEARRELLVKKQGNGVYFSVRLALKPFNWLYALLTRRSVSVLKVGVMCLLRSL